MKEDLISIECLETQVILELLGLTEKIKAERDKYADALKGKSLGLIFQKPSNRTCRIYTITKLCAISGKNH